MRGVARSRVSALAIMLTIILSTSGAVVVPGQGGTGKGPTAPAPKKTPPKKPGSVGPGTSAARRTASREVMPPTGGAWIRFIWIPPGTFTMGSETGEPDEKPSHRVTISEGFYLGRYEVTQANWHAVMGSNPSNFKDCANCPVEQVSWDDVQSFIQKLNQANDGYSYRLPTEAEWEYACRAGTRGDYEGNLSEVGWYSANSGDRPHSVGGKQPNAFGLFDMHGNVWEWCQDWYHETYDGAPTDGSAWLSGGGKDRVLRGGSWKYHVTSLRSASRFFNTPYRSDDNFGFRIVAVSRIK